MTSYVQEEAYLVALSRYFVNRIQMLSWCFTYFNFSSKTFSFKTFYNHFFLRYLYFSPIKSLLTPKWEMNVEMPSPTLTESPNIWWGNHRLIFHSGPSYNEVINNSKFVTSHKCSWQQVYCAHRGLWLLKRTRGRERVAKKRAHFQIHVIYSDCTGHRGKA